MNELELRTVVVSSSVNEASEVSIMEWWDGCPFKGDVETFCLQCFTLGLLLHPCSYWWGALRSYGSEGICSLRLAKL